MPLVFCHTLNTKTPVSGQIHNCPVNVIKDFSFVFLLLLFRAICLLESVSK